VPFRNNILAGTALVRDAIHSPNYVAGVSGWSINKDGSAELNNVTIRGDFVATNGTDSVRIANTPNPRVEFYKSGVTLPSTIIGNRPFGTGDTGIQFASAGTAGHTKTVEQLDEFGWRVFDNANPSNLFGIDFPGTDPETESAHADSIGGVSTLRADGSNTWLSVLADGRVGTGIATTPIGTTDTNIGSANNVNTPVILDRAYMAIVQLDYFRSTTGALARLDMKLWNGAVGGTQLGGTVRIGMVGPLSTARRTAVGIFVWRAFTTETIVNLNLSLATTDGTVGQNWTAEVNAGFVFTVMEIGNANNISNL